MARRKKNRVVDTITHKGGLSVDIMFNPNPDSLGFSAEFGGQRFGSKVADEVKAWARKTLKEACDLEWLPVIEVQTYTERGRGSFGLQHSIGLQFRRFYYAVKPDGGVLESDWDADRPTFGRERERIDSAREFYWKAEVPFTPPVSVDGGYDGKISNYLPYKDVTWAGLRLLADKLKQLKGMINELVSTEEGQARLQTVAQNLLSEGGGVDG